MFTLITVPKLCGQHYTKCITMLNHGSCVLSDQELHILTQFGQAHGTEWLSLTLYAAHTYSFLSKGLHHLKVDLFSHRCFFPFLFSFFGCCWLFNVTIPFLLDSETMLLHKDLPNSLHLMIYDINECLQSAKNKTNKNHIHRTWSHKTNYIMLQEHLKTKQHHTLTFQIKVK